MNLFSLFLPRTARIRIRLKIQTFLAPSFDRVWRASADTTSRSGRPSSARYDCHRRAIADREAVGFAVTALQVILPRKWKPPFYENEFPTRTLNGTAFLLGALPDGLSKRAAQTLLNPPPADRRFTQSLRARHLNAKCLGQVGRGNRRTTID